MSVTNKEKNFISAVVYLHNDGAQAVRFFKALNAVLDQHFEQYELVAVDDACADDTIPTLRDWAKALEKPLTILHLSLHQGPRDRHETRAWMPRSAIMCMSLTPPRHRTPSSWCLKLTVPPWRAAILYPSARGPRLAAAKRSTACSTATAIRLQAAHRCVPPGQPPRHQPRACFQ